MNAIFDYLKEFFLWGDYGRIFGGVARSPKWESFKRDYERLHPKQCAVCGNTKCSLHHKQVFHLHPEMELIESNVCWLCEGLGTLQHHRGMGHLGSFLSWNENIDEDVLIWNGKFMHRP